ncbi:MAG: NAD(+)/NADH kinase [Bacilli bacterium]
MKPCSFAIFTCQLKAKDSDIDTLCQGLLDQGFSLDDDNPDLVVVIGGDGSLLKACHEYEFTGHFLLINSGHLGFFSDYSIEEIDAFLSDILHNEPNYETLPLMEIDIDGQDYYAINDLVIQSERTAEFNLAVNNQTLTSSRASGIVVGTPISSTGYLSSLGAPIVVSDASIYQYSFIAPVFNRLFPNTISKGILSAENSLAIAVEGPSIYIIDGIPVSKDSEAQVNVTMSKDKEVSIMHLKEISNIRRIRKSVLESED